MKVNRFDEKLLKESLEPLAIEVKVFDKIDSTNAEARRYAENGGHAPAVFIAEAQSAGRGRLGRSFYSPEGTGIYLSLLLPLEGELGDAVLMTSGAAVGVMRAIREVTGISVGIKWVNDLYFEGKKICGILAQSFVCDSKRYAVLGVGVNLCTQDFPDELCGIAGSIGCGAELKTRLAVRIVKELYTVCSALPKVGFMDEYRASSLVLGNAVTYTKNGETYGGVAESIDDHGRLYVRREDGECAMLDSGEISLRIEK